MNEQRAREILGTAVKSDSFLEEKWCDYLAESKISWLAPSKYMELRGEFTLEELEAIAYWMREKGQDNDQSK